MMRSWALPFKWLACLTGVMTARQGGNSPGARLCSKLALRVAKDSDELWKVLRLDPPRAH